MGDVSPFVGFTVNAATGSPEKTAARRIQAAAVSRVTKRKTSADTLSHYLIQSLQTFGSDEASVGLK